MLWALLALCAAAFAATFWWPGRRRWAAGWARERRLRGCGGSRCRRPEPPASRYGREAGLVAHRDFALLADPMATANTRDLDFYSWLAAQQAAGGSAAEPLPIGRRGPRADAG